MFSCNAHIYFDFYLLYDENEKKMTERIVSFDFCRFHSCVQNP